MKPRLSLIQSPRLQLMSQGREITACEKIFEFRCGCWDTSHDLVASSAGKHDAMSSRNQPGCELPAHLIGEAATGARRRHKPFTPQFTVEQFLVANLNIAAAAAARLVDFV